MVLTKSSLQPSDVHLANILKTMSVEYANDDFIGHQIMPEFFTGKMTGTWYVYDKRRRLAVPDDEVSTDGKRNETSQGRTRSSYTLTIRGLEEFLDQYTIEDQDAPLDEVMDLGLNVLYGLAFREELRIITACTTAGNFGSNTQAIAAGDRITAAGGGDPMAIVDTMKAAVWSGNGPGSWVLTTSLTGYNIIKRHPQVLASLAGASTRGPAFATQDQLAEFFGVDKFLVGRARKDTANIGQTESYSRMWSDVLLLTRVADTPSRRNAVFGWSLKSTPTASMLNFDPNRGGKGGLVYSASHADQQKIAAADTGYLTTTPFA
jgi:hypothetical protein